MIKGIIAIKEGMTSLFNSDGNQIPVTILKAGPCIVTQIKTTQIDGYNAIQLGFDEKNINKINLPLKGHFKKVGEVGYKILKEFREQTPENFKIGQRITVGEVFTIGEKINVTGTMKGRGFTGVIKRHGFHGGKSTHGSMCHRIPGSIGASATPGRVVKGKKLPGQYGNTKKTIKNLEIIDIRPEKNIIIVKGAVPGSNKSQIILKKIN